MLFELIPDIGKLGPQQLKYPANIPPQSRPKKKNTLPIPQVPPPV